MKELGPISEEIRRWFSAKNAAREKALRLSREVIRYSSVAIRAVHRQEYPRAEEQLSSAQALLGEVREILAEYGDLLHAGYFQDAQKEFAEGNITLALISGNTLPTPKTLQVSYAAYLNGMGEAVGELRRHLLDIIRKGDLSRGEELLAAMDDIYGELVTMDFPDAITGGLRRTTDIVRGILERTRGDLTMTFTQKGLEKRLETFERPSTTV